MKHLHQIQPYKNQVDVRRIMIGVFLVSAFIIGFFTLNSPATKEFAADLAQPLQEE